MSLTQRLCLTTVLAAGLAVAAAAPAEPPATQPVANQPTTAVSPEVDAILTRQEKAGDAIKTLQAGLRDEIYYIIPDDRQVKLGLIRYQAAAKGKNARFMVMFDTLIHEDLKVKQKEYWCFDGHKLREIRQQTRTAIDREVVAPDEKIDPFKLGEGPIPLPFGQKKADILQNFNVTLIKPEKTDPAGTDHLHLVPKPGTKFTKKYKSLDFWVDRKLNLPIKIAWRDTHSSVVTVDFKDIQINKPLADNQLWVDVPLDYGYQKEKL